MHEEGLGFRDFGFPKHLVLDLGWGVKGGARSHPLTVSLLNLGMGLRP